MTRYFRKRVEKTKAEWLIEKMECNDKYISIISNYDRWFVIHYIEGMYYIVKDRKNAMILSEYKTFKKLARDIYKNLYNNKKKYDNLKLFIKDKEKAKEINNFINNIELKNKEDDIKLIEILLLYLI